MEKVQEIKNTARLPRPETGRVGWRCSHRLVLPRHKAIANLPNKCLEVMAGSGEPALSAMARPMDRTVWMVSSARLPKVSATRGMNSVPVERQAERFEANLRWRPAWRACPGVCEASAMVCCWRGLMMWTSRAADHSSS